MKYGKIILDTDICIKTGNYEKVKFLEMIIPKIAEKAYMHRYVYENELLTPKNAKDQIFSIFLFIKLINKLKREKKVEIVQTESKASEEVLLLREIRDLLNISCFIQINSKDYTSILIIVYYQLRMLFQFVFLNNKTTFFQG